MTGIIALVDYGAGNLHSVHNALKKAGGVHVEVTSDPALVRGAARVVLPGVGAFRACRDALAAVPGMIEAMEEAVLERGVPFLGICVGMQLLAERGEEYGSHEGLGWIPGAVRLIERDDPALKVPHMGWNARRFSRLPRGAGGCAGHDRGEGGSRAGTRRALPWHLRRHAVAR